MMMIPRKNNYDLLDDIFDGDFFINKYPKNELMKTDIKEHKNSYEMITDLPGYQKDQIKISVDDGYLTISAHKKSEEEKNENHGRVVRKERYYGECERSFYVGDQIEENDIKASFKDGVLDITIPKKEPQKLEQSKKYIEIE